MIFHPVSCPTTIAASMKRAADKFRLANEESQLYRIGTKTELVSSLRCQQQEEIEQLGQVDM